MGRCSREVFEGGVRGRCSREVFEGGVRGRCSREVSERRQGKVRKFYRSTLGPERKSLGATTSQLSGVNRWFCGDSSWKIQR